MSEFAVRFYAAIDCEESNTREFVELISSLPFVPFPGLSVLVTPNDFSDPYELTIKFVQWDCKERIFECRVDGFKYNTRDEFENSIKDHERLGWTTT